MKRKYLLKTPFKVALLARLLAKSIDLFIVLILSIFFYPFGILLALIYMGVCDSLQEGQSVGKKFIGFSVISLIDGSPCSLRQSIVRNLPIMLPLFFAIIPIWGMIISILIGIPLFVFELYLLFKLDSGHRLGDVMADTSVMGQNTEMKIKSQTSTSWFDEGTNPS
jgi:uncharacterized RDD family membrane protein YckC